MTEIVLMKAGAGVLVAADQQSADQIDKLKLGAGLRVKYKRANNVLFHRKMFALANLAYEAWEPGEMEYRGQPVGKSFEQFRDDLTILAGFYSTAVRLDGTLRIIADSWAFDSMDDERKERLYNAIINVVLRRVLTKYTRADLDAVIEKLLRFDR